MSEASDGAAKLLGEPGKSLLVERTQDPHTGEHLYHVEPHDFDASPDLIGAIMVALGAGASLAIRGKWTPDQFARVAEYAFKRERGDFKG